MQFLPIVERELRVAAHQPRTWWQRVLTLGVATLLFVFVYVSVGQWANASEVGRQLFNMLSGFGLVYSLLAGPLLTADCLGRERREGTLGLLFLTDLRSYDVVLGKVAAASLSFVLALMAALPLGAIPFLLGGVTLTQFVHVVLALLDIMFLSLALGVCASACLVSGRASLGISFLALIFLTLGVPLLGEEVFEISTNGKLAAWFYMACPLWTMRLCLDGLPGKFGWNYGLNLAGLHGLAWLCLVVACLRTGRAWRDLPASALGLRWRERFERWGRGTARARLTWRQRMLDRNPVSWLEGRDALQSKLIWGLFLVATIFWSVKHLQSPQSWPDSDLVILWPLFAHYLVCLWLAIQAPRRLGDDKQSGALELLLCTPLAPRTIVHGTMLMLWRRFGRVVVASVVLALLMLYIYLDTRVWNPGSQTGELIQLSLCGLIVFPLQGYSLARIGQYQGLVHASSLRATFMLVWKIGLLPWALFISSILLYESLRQHFRFLPRVTDSGAYVVWTVTHVLVCGLALAYANWQLRRNFRLLATQTLPRAWWKRFLVQLASGRR